MCIAEKIPTISIAKIIATLLSIFDVIPNTIIAALGVDQVQCGAVFYIVHHPWSFLISSLSTCWN